MKLILTLITTLALTGCFAKPDPFCAVKAELAYSVAVARDAGVSKAGMLSLVQDSAESANQREIIKQVFIARHVSPVRTQEIFLAKCQ